MVGFVALLVVLRLGNVATSPGMAKAEPSNSLETLLADFRAAESEYVRATEMLARGLEERRDEIAPETLELLDVNLALIDAAIVEVTDATGATFQVATNETGNFDMGGEIVFPAYTRVISNGTTLEMIAPLEGPQDADCNTCHSQNGVQSAPGRIILPPN